MFRDLGAYQITYTTGYQNHGDQILILNAAIPVTEKLKEL